MKPKKILSMVMTFLMVLSLLPSFVFAAEAPAGELGGKLKIKGTAAVGSVLSADYTKVTPEGLTDDYVSITWSRMVGDQVTEVSKEKTYTLVDEDLGNKIQMKITGVTELGVTGEMKANTVAIAATPEEAPAETTEEKNDEGAETGYVEEPTVDEIPGGEEDVLLLDPPAEELGEIPEAVDEQGVPADQAEVMQPAENTQEEYIPETADDDSVDSSVLDIGTEETLVVPEGGEPAETPDAAVEPLTYEAVAVVDNENGVMDFGTLEEGYTEVPAEQYVTIKNTGTGTLNFNGIAPEHFMAQDIMAPLGAGESVTLWIVPREGIAAGIYQDPITYTTEEGISVSFDAAVTVNAPQAQDNGTDTVVTDPAVTDPADPVVTDPAVTDPADPVVTDPANPADPVVTDTPDPADPSVTDTPDPAEPVVTGTPDPADPDVTVTPEPTVIPEPPKANVQATEGLTDGALTFDTIKQGQQAPAAKTVKLFNSGDKDVVLQPVSNNFQITAAEGSFELKANSALTLNVAPAKAEAGTYDETITLKEADTENVLLTFSVKYTIADADNPNLSASAAPVFESMEEGYAQAPAAQTVTLTNTGNIPLTELSVEAGGQEFNVSALSAATVDVNGTVTFNVAPIVGLKEGTHVQSITVKSKEAQPVTVTATFTVTAAAVKLTGVNKPGDINLANGVEKSAAGLKLPSSVTINTNKGSMNASVTWDVKGCAYNQKSTDAQKFSVKGTIALPNGVTNPDGLNLITSVNVVVSRAPKIADAANNSITGISADGAYTTETKITFTAVGAGMDNTSPIKGDTRYLPLYWEVLEARSWDSAPYSATFRMGKNGSYTLTVTYNQQKFDGSNWASTGTQDTKQVSFSVSAAGNVTVTPAANKADANQKKAVQTGDDTPIMTFVIILVVAVVLIAGILVYRKKKR